MFKLLIRTCLILFAFFTKGNHHPQADMLFINGTIITMEQPEDHPQALAVKDGKIMALGDLNTLMALKGKKTQVIDLQGKTLMPGFIDAHSHFGMAAAFTSGMAKVYPPPFGEVSSIDELILSIKAFIKAKNIQPGKAVLAWGYDDSVIGRHPTRDDLNKISTEHPVYVIHISGHIGIGNDMALEQARIDRHTPSPRGGHIAKDENGEPTGLLEENSNIQTIMQFYKAPNAKELYKAIKETQNNWLKYGQTTAVEGRITEHKMWLMLKASSAMGLLDIDVIALPDYDYFKGEINHLHKKWKHYHKHLKVGGIKFSQDGSPQGKTAWLSKPYLHPPHLHNSDYSGYPIYSDSVLKTGIEKVLQSGFTFHSHNNGDAAADQLIRVLKALKAEGKYTGNERVVLVHGQTVRKDQLRALKELGIIPSYFSLHAFAWGDWYRSEILGEERAAMISPTNSSLKEGLLFTIHHDAPVVPPNTILLLWSTVNRITRSGHILGNEQISTYEALKALTINAAYQWSEEKTKGSLKQGKLADMIVLSENPLTMDPKRLNELKVLETFKEGKLLYRAETEYAH